MWSSYNHIYAACGDNKSGEVKVFTAYFLQKIQNVENQQSSLNHDWIKTLNNTGEYVELFKIFNQRHDVLTLLKFVLIVDEVFDILPGDSVSSARNQRSRTSTKLRPNTSIARSKRIKRLSCFFGEVILFIYGSASLFPSQRDSSKKYILEVLHGHHGFNTTVQGSPKSSIYALKFSASNRSSTEVYFPLLGTTIGEELLVQHWNKAFKGCVSLECAGNFRMTLNVTENELLAPTLIPTLTCEESDHNDLVAADPTEPVLHTGGNLTLLSPANLTGTKLSIYNLFEDMCGTFMNSAKKAKV